MLKINVNPALFALNFLPVQGELKKMLSSFAGKKLLVSIGGKTPLECRLNARATSIRGRGLRELVMQSGATVFTVTLGEDSVLYLIPDTERRPESMKLPEQVRVKCNRSAKVRTEKLQAAAGRAKRRKRQSRRRVAEPVTVYTGKLLQL